MTEHLQAAAMTMSHLQRVVSVLNEGEDPLPALEAMPSVTDLPQRQAAEGGTRPTGQRCAPAPIALRCRREERDVVVQRASCLRSGRF
jgi:hypothetical protein